MKEFYTTFEGLFAYLTFLPENHSCLYFSVEVTRLTFFSTFEGSNSYLNLVVLWTYLHFCFEDNCFVVQS